jgi:hypothetical protein
MNKLNVLKRMFGKKVVVIEDHIKMIHWFGIVSDIVNESTLKIKNQDGNLFDVSIFDIRNPTKEFVEKYL